MDIKTQEALKMAIEWIENPIYFGQVRWNILKACKEALEQPAREPSKLEMAGFDLDGVIADGYREGLDNVSLSTIKRVRKTISDYVEQPAQEPDYWLGYGLQAHEEKPFYGATPLYTHPAPSWQGLSDDEIFNLCGYIDHDLLEEAFYRGARAGEQALKEKNT